MNGCEHTFPTCDMTLENASQIFGEALADYGFCLLVNHGIPADLFVRLDREVSSFLRMPIKMKKKHLFKNSY